MSEVRLEDSWMLGSLRVPNRVMLAPLAGIGNWFVRLQAKRYGAGMAVSEMVSSHAIHYGNEKTCTEMLRIDPREREGGPVAIQLFGEDPATMRSAAAVVAEVGADAIDINMGCPVPKVRKTGAGAALLGDPDRAVAVARATVRGRRRAWGGWDSGDRQAALGPDGGARAAVSSWPTAWSRRPGVAAIGFHPRSAAVHHKGHPDYELAARLVATLPAPVILTGGLDDVRRRARGLRRDGGGGRDARPRRAGQPLAVRRACWARSDREPTPAEVLRASSTGRSSGPSSTSASRARPATCASSTPGTCPAWRWRPRRPAACRNRCRAPRR